MPLANASEQIRYQFSEPDLGARIRVLTSSPETTDAVHAFLLFQVIDHRTQDNIRRSSEELITSRGNLRKLCLANSRSRLVGDTSSRRDL